jgi:ferredoxin
MHTVTLQPSGHQFQVEEGEAVLAAALRQGFVLPYGCKNGACGSCKGKILSGSVDYGVYQPGSGVFADEVTETIARLSVEHYLAQGSIPNKEALVRKYYGEDLPSVSMFIGFDKFSVFDMPLLSTGEEDLYFSVSPSPYMTTHQLRAILYAHIYVRPIPEPDYTKLPAEELNWLRDYYRHNKDYAFGVGKLKFNLWFPEIGNGS